VFAGGWTLEAAETVGAGEAVTPGDVVELLAHLIDKSLVSVEAPAEFTRYRLLETIRQYSLAKLAASGEADLVRRRHAAYYLAVAEPGGSNRWGDFDLQPVWLDQVETEHDNMRAALTWTQSATGSAELGLRLAGALAQFWFWREYWYEGRDWLEAALAHADAEGVNHPPARAGLLRVLGGMRALLADYAAGEALLATSLQLFQELGDTYMSAWSLERLGWLARERGDAATARRRLEESLTLFRQLGHEHGIAWASVTLGEVAVMLEDGPWATALIEEALTLFHRHGITLGMGWALNHLGHVAQIQGKYEQAIRLHEESLPLFRKIGPKNLGVGWAFQGLGESALAQDDAALAVRHFMEALGLFRDMGDRTGMAWCLAGLAGAAASSEEPERAAWLWGAAEALRQSIGARPAPAARATRERLQAQVHAQLGDDTFNEAWAGGGAATPEQAIARALQSNE
jgi:tetratricopeptide (TPR) repeat protein